MTGPTAPSVDPTDTVVTMGRRYRDVISGFEGIATGRFTYLYGCVRVQLESVALEGGDVKVDVFDEQRLVDVATDRPPVATATSGGPRSAPPSRRTS